MAFDGSSQLAGGSSATAAVPVPSGTTAANKIVCVALYKENTAAVTTIPTGFTLKSTINTNAATQGSIYLFWKRLTAADSGTYTFGWTGAVWRAAAAGMWSGRITSGDPFDGTVGTAESGASSVQTVNVAASPALADGDALGIWTNWTGGNAWTPPTNYIERVENDVITLDTRDAIAAGSTGNISATATSAAGPMKATLGVLISASASVVSGPIPVVSQYSGIF